MNVTVILIASLVATVVLTTTLAAAQGLGYTRMSIPYLVGTIFTAGRDRAMVVGVAVHFANGILFALLYAAVFEAVGRSGVLLGLAGGLLHAVFVLTVGMVVLPGLHPHMVSEYYGPTPNRLLQPPGFLALHYGRRTPIVTTIAHALYGAILGWMYRVS